MARPSRSASATSKTPAQLLSELGSVFATFDQQDSGNVSYGVAIGYERFFVKTPGSPQRPATLSHAQRVQLLRNAQQLAEQLQHSTLPRLVDCLDSAHGPMLLYAWFDGELLGVPRQYRSDPASAFSRFKALPTARICKTLSDVFDLHAQLAERGWVASDFYDGCLMFEFTTGESRVIDLDHYHQGPFENQMGRMFGSTRFMAPEELTRGAPITERTTVFNLGRCIEVFVGQHGQQQDAFMADSARAIARRACSAHPSQRFASVAEFHKAWHDAVDQ